MSRSLLRPWSVSTSNPNVRYSYTPTDTGGIPSDDNNASRSPTGSTAGDTPADIDPLSRAQLLDWIRDVDSEQDRLARRIVAVLRHGLISCGPDSHLEAERDHDRRCNVHVKLQETYKPRHMDQSGPTRAETSLRMGLRRGQWPATVDPALILGARSDFPKASRLRHTFTGATGVSSEETHICLHGHRAPASRLAISRYDVDSAISVFSDLSDLRHTLSYCPVPQPTRQLTKTLHIVVPIEVQDQTDVWEIEYVKVHRIPHIVFSDIDNHPLYIFFPYLFRRDDKEPARLRNEQY